MYTIMVEISKFEAQEPMEPLIITFSATYMFKSLTLNSQRHTADWPASEHMAPNGETKLALVAQS